MAGNTRERDMGRRELRTAMKVGDIVRIVAIDAEFHDPTYHDDPNMGTSALFRFCLGRQFKIAGFDRYGHVQLEVSNSPAVRAQFGPWHTIWLKPEQVRVVRKRSRGRKAGDRRPATGD